MKSKKLNYVWVAPIITLAIMLIIYAANGVYPFGVATTAFSDGFSQYTAFLAELTYKTRNGGSLFFTWHTGGGQNFWTLMGYYLMSPLNVLAFLFPAERMADAFALITLIKPSFLALSFGIFLKHSYKKNDLSVAIFSVLWAMSGFIFASMIMTTWLDAMFYFPLAVLGLKRMMEGKRAILYSVSLGLTVATNFYIGWMVCIFCIIYFIYMFISDDEVVFEGVTGEAEKASKDSADDETAVDIFGIFKNSYLLSRFFKFFASSLLAGALSAVITLPMLSSLQNTGKGLVSDNVFNTDKNGIFGILASHIFPFKNVYISMVSAECIFCFVGIASIILTVAYFFTKGISARKKIGNLILLVIMWISIILQAPYFVWHGFGIPAGLMYRFAFIYSFIILKIAYEAFCEIKNIPVYGIAAGTAFAVLCTAAIKINKFFEFAFYSNKLIIAIAIFIAVFTAVLLVLGKKTKLKTVLTCILLVCVVAESVMFNINNLNTLKVQENFGEKKYVDEFTADLAKSDRVHFATRITNYKDMLMHGALFGYNSLENFSSLADFDFTLSVTDLGTYGNRLNYQDGAKEQTPIFNMFFPTNYYIDGTGRISESVYRTKISEKDGYTLYKNNYTMPFMYTVSSKISNWDPFAYFLVMDNLNESAKALTDTNEDIVCYNTPSDFKFENCVHIPASERAKENGNEMPPEYFEFIEKRMSGYSYRVDDMTKPAYITFNSVAETDGIMYLYVDTYELTDMTVTLNGKTNEYYLFGKDDNCTFELGQVKKGDVATITIGGYRDNDFGNGNVYGHKSNSFTTLSYTVDMEKFEKAYQKLDSMSDTQMLEFKDTYVKAKVNSFEDGLLYIPTAFDKGWKITIDGNEVPLYEHESHILMTEISKGEHIVEMKYCPQGFTAGAAVTGVSVVILIAWAVISKKRRSKINAAERTQKDVSEE